jgi:hypothetical protein
LVRLTADRDAALRDAAEFSMAVHRDVALQSDEFVQRPAAYPAVLRGAGRAETVATAAFVPVRAEDRSVVVY